jgi:trans-aconitate 2-methyltransferase
VTLRWDGRGYHRVASVQEAWGRALLEEIPPGDYRRILDAGCGSGRLTQHLLRRFPDATVTALDRSADMLEQAGRTLARFRRRVRLVEADLLAPLRPCSFDLVFSNATFHWVTDHDRLFRNCAAALVSGGRLIAQSGGHGNLRRVETASRRASSRPEFRREFRGFRRPVYYAPAAATRARLARAGFSEAAVWLAPSPQRFPTLKKFRDFARHVTLVPNFARLSDDARRAAYLDAFVDAYRALFGHPLVLDYVRLNVRALR